MNNIKHAIFGVTGVLCFVGLNSFGVAFAADRKIEKDPFREPVSVKEMPLENKSNIKRYEKQLEKLNEDLDIANIAISDYDSLIKQGEGVFSTVTEYFNQCNSAAILFQSYPSESLSRIKFEAIVVDCEKTRPSYEEMLNVQQQTIDEIGAGIEDAENFTRDSLIFLGVLRSRIKAEKEIGAFAVRAKRHRERKKRR